VIGWRAPVTERLNRQVLLTSRPAGIPQAEHFDIVAQPVVAPRDGEILVRNIFLSVDPAMRGWVSPVANYSTPVPIGGVMRAYAAGQIEHSADARFGAGDFVTGQFGWQEFATVKADAVIRKVEDTTLPLSTALGVLGMTGLTAYFGLLDAGQPQSGETVIVSTAAGAVGSCVGQIAKLKGCRTVGIAGGPVKRQLCLDEYGYDAAVDYKTPDFAATLDTAIPDGADVYFDNTSGAISDAVLPKMRPRARIVICGTASISSWDPWPSGPRVERYLLVKRARMQGILVSDYTARYPEAIRELSAWVRSGALRYREDILDGIEQAPGAIAGLYRGENIGKRLIRLT